MTSNSLEGATTIVLEFDPSVNIDSAAVDVQSALYQTMKKLPAEMTTPIISQGESGRCADSADWYRLTVDDAFGS